MKTTIPPKKVSWREPIKIRYKLQTPKINQKINVGILTFNLASSIRKYNPMYINKLTIIIQQAY
jgi:hypothetical protein